MRGQSRKTSVLGDVCLTSKRRLMTTAECGVEKTRRTVYASVNRTEEDERVLPAFGRQNLLLLFGKHFFVFGEVARYIFCTISELVFIFKLGS